MSAVAYWYQREPCPAGTALPPPERRFAPPEAVGRAALMAELFELERKGLPAEAEERCLIHADEYRGAPENPVVLLRALAYGEAAGGYAGVAEAYRRAAAQEAGKDAGAEAAALLWFHEAPTNALVGAHMNGRYRVFLDGRPAGEGDSPVRLAVERAAVGPGEHELAVEVTPTRADAWMSLHLRAHGTNVTSDGTWECARARPRDWPATGDPAVAWQKVQSGHEFLPKMAYWQFMPNAFVFMQSGRQLVRAWAGWDANPGAVTAYFRKRFVLPGP
jgi:hypothetical protein